ncbi:EAL domain, c-di-GMP-specific phosphodiesterase class I (or its enzymatically inactive variant) [Pseudomonas saponiphila]|uniref:EAL domain, c-di-GMP-specific phosphodiesterase class I (Or its enzymatically inactive variant) n=1 Tax=Pseudomonas saponiphila TaxID=556534 RepID=A0A1H4XBV0_9PSED|nr:EAL domain-containing response regulator [Pseudomonas saponiphila]SED02660.1 EAL domain, c-di-GMP-specific phosphodiesterase class I (or its enzymatically inactive variant) [Pseudomonas saponiphila]
MHTLNVLILEDNSFQLMALHQMLNANGVFNVLAAESVAAARRSLDSKGPVDIAICDLYLEQADGLELIRDLAQRQQAKALIILSDAEPDVLEGASDMARELGLKVLACLPKPASAAVIGDLLCAYQLHARADGPELNQALLRDLLCLEPFVRQAVTVDEGLAAVLGCGVAHFQPVIHPQGGLQGVEALARWQHPERGLLMPGEFLPLIEFAGLQELFTWHMLEQALELVAGVKLVLGYWLPIAVNIPTGILERPLFPRQLEALLRRFEVPARMLTLELVDTTQLQTDTAHVEALLRLRMLGCKLSIGDFGTGGTSLQRLLELPFTELKIPPVFVAGMAVDERKLALVAGATSMARRMSLAVVVTGIESEADCLAARALGAVHLQGCFIAPPMSAAEMRQWLAQTPGAGCNGTDEQVAGLCA